MRNKGWIVAAVLLLVAILAFFVWKGQEKGEEKEVVKIGVILPLTGDAAVYGEAMKNGVDLAYSQSKVKNKVNLIFQDDQGETSKSNSSTQFLLTKDVNAIIGGAQSKTAEVIIPTLKERGIPLISPGASSVEFDTISNYFFRLWPSDSYEGKILAEHISSKHPNSKMAIFYTNSSYGVSIEKTFTENLLKNGNTIVFNERFEEGASDYKSQLLKLKQSNAENLFLPGYIKEIKIIITQMIEMGINMNIYGTISLKDEELYKLAKDADLNIHFSQPKVDTTENTASLFISMYEKQYDKEPDVFAKNAYDCLYVILESIENNAITPEEIKNYLLGRQFNGASGTFSFDKKGNVIKNFEVIKLSDVYNKNKIEKKNQ